MIRDWELFKRGEEPPCDLAICSECGWRGLVSDCIEVQERDWEYGYYIGHDCPVCKDGGCIEYEMSEERAKEWLDWNKKVK